MSSMSKQSYFLGAMAPWMFLETFMGTRDDIPPAPEADFQDVLTGQLVQEMYEPFVSLPFFEIAYRAEQPLRFTRWRSSGSVQECDYSSREQRNTYRALHQPMAKIKIPMMKTSTIFALLWPRRSNQNQDEGSRRDVPSLNTTILARAC